MKILVDIPEPIGAILARMRHRDAPVKFFLAAGVLRNWAKENQVSIGSIAREVGTTASHFSRWLHGKDGVSDKYRARLVTLTGIDGTDLFTTETPAAMPEIVDPGRSPGTSATETSTEP